MAAGAGAAGGEGGNKSRRCIGGRVCALSSFHSVRTAGSLVLLRACACAVGLAGGGARKEGMREGRKWRMEGRRSKGGGDAVRRKQSRHAFA